MRRFLTRALRRSLRLLLEAMAAFVGLVFVLALLLIWRANQGPIVIDSLAPQLSRLLSNAQTGTRTEIGHAQLMWFRDDKALRLVAATVKVYDGKNRLVAELPQLALGLNFLAPLHGQLAPLEIFSRNFNLRLTRSAGGGVQLGDVALPESNAVASPPVTKDDIANYIRDFLHLDTSWFGLGRVGAVRLGNVQIVVADAERRVDWATFTIPQLTLVRQRGNVQLSGAVQAQLGEGVRSDIHLTGAYDKRRRAVTVQLDFAALNLAASARALGLPAAYASLDVPLTGSISAQFDQNIILESATISLNGQAGHLAISDLWPKPLAFNDLALRANINLQTRTVALEQALLNFNGVKLSATLKAAPLDETQPDELQVAARVAVNDWPLKRLTEIWPESVAPNPRAWISQHMSVGHFTEVAADLGWRTRWQEPLTMSAVTVRGLLALENASIDYLKGMPPVTGVSGTAVADRSNMTINLKGGKAGRVTLDPAPIVIKGLDADNQTIDIQLLGKNNVSDIVHLLDQPPLHYARRIGLSAEQVSGTAQLDVKLGFPLLKDLPLAAMQIDARAKISDFVSDKLIKGLAISKGALDLAVDGAQLSITGKADYNGVALETAYAQRFAADKAKPMPQATANLRGVLSAADWKNLGVPFAEGMTGKTPLTLTYEKRFDAAASLGATIDLTPAALRLPQLGWQKAEKQAGSAKIALQLGKERIAVKQLQLRGPELTVDVSGTLDATRFQPTALTCQPCKIARNDFKAKASFNDAGDLTEAVLSGNVVDYHASEKTPAPSIQTTPASPPKPMKVKLDIARFYQGSDRYFTNLRGSLKRDAQGWDAVELAALAEGKVPVSIALQLQNNGTRRLNISTDDLGAVLRAADVTDQVRGGKLQILGNSSAQAPYRLEGEIQLRKYRVRKLPVLAVLLNAASFTGFADLLAGEGLNFDRLEGRFVWDSHQVYTLRDVRTAGGALGLNIEGTLDFTKNQTNLHGTIVPFSFFNSMIGAIPIVGDILTGGKGGGLVAATYEIKGPIEKLDVSVNPVSFLAPGILRRIFFQS